MFAYATDPSQFSEWQKGVVDGRMDNSGTPTVSDRCLTTRRIGWGSGARDVLPGRSVLDEEHPPVEDAVVDEVQVG